jgi:hypothetical protein
MLLSGATFGLKVFLIRRKQGVKLFVSRSLFSRLKIETDIHRSIAMALPCVLRWERLPEIPPPIIPR